MTTGTPPSSDEERVPPPETRTDTAAALRRGFARSRWRRLLRIAGGVVMLVLGVAGLFLPFLQGLIFLAIGAALLAPDVPLVRRLVVSAYRRWPRVRRAVPRRLRRVGRDDPPESVEVPGDAEERSP